MIPGTFNPPLISLIGSQTTRLPKATRGPTSLTLPGRSKYGTTRWCPQTRTATPQMIQAKDRLGRWSWWSCCFIDVYWCLLLNTCYVDGIRNFYDGGNILSLLTVNISWGYDLMTHLPSSICVSPANHKQRGFDIGARMITSRHQCHDHRHIANTQLEKLITQ